MTLRMYLASEASVELAYRNFQERYRLVDLAIELLSGLTDATSEHQLRILAEQQGLEQAWELELGVL